MEVNSVGPHFTGRDEVLRRCDWEDASWAFGPSSAPGGNQVFPVYKKVPEVNAKGKEARLGQVVRRQQRRP